MREATTSLKTYLVKFSFEQKHEYVRVHTRYPHDVLPQAREEFYFKHGFYAEGAVILPDSETAECEKCFKIFPADNVYEVEGDLICEPCHV